MFNTQFHNIIMYTTDDTSPYNDGMGFAMVGVFVIEVV